jgi:hypothetical protein
MASDSKLDGEALIVEGDVLRASVNGMYVDGMIRGRSLRIHDPAALERPLRPGEDPQWASRSRPRVALGHKKGLGAAVGGELSQDADVLAITPGNTYAGGVWVEGDIAVGGKLRLLDTVSVPNIGPDLHEHGGGHQVPTLVDVGELIRDLRSEVRTLQQRVAVLEHRLG